MKVMYRFYDSSDSTILPEDCYESDVPIPRFFRVLLIKVVQILRFYLRIVMKVMYRFYDSSDSTILSEDCYESDVPIPRFFRFYDFTSRVLLIEVVQILRFFRFYDFT